MLSTDTIFDANVTVLKISDSTGQPLIFGSYVRLVYTLPVLPEASNWFFS